MGYLQELEAAQMSEALLGAAEKRVLSTLTIHRDGTWLNLQSRLLAIRDGRLVFERPAAPSGGEPLDLGPAEKVGVSFKYRHHKHLFASTIADLAQLSFKPGQVTEVLRLGIPAGMQRVQRRAYYRAPIPEGQVVRVSFWLGGLNMRPGAPTPERPVWSGRLRDLSAGGFLVQVPCDASRALDAGDMIGLRVNFGSAGEMFTADAQIRHVCQEARAPTVGAQFVGLEQDPGSKAALRLITTKVSQYQRLSLAAQGRGGRNLPDSEP